MEPTPTTSGLSAPEPGPPETESSHMFASRAAVTPSVSATETAWLESVSRLSGALWWITSQRGLVAGQQALSAFTGLPEDSLLGAGWLDAIAPPDRSAAREQWDTLNASAASVETSWRFVRPHGQPAAWLTVGHQPLPVVSGAEPHTLWFGRPTTRARATDGAGRLGALFEQSAQGILMLDAKGAPLRANQAALRMLGLSLEQARGAAPLPPGWRCEREDGTRVVEPFRALSEAVLALTTVGETGVARSTEEAGGYSRLFWQVIADGWSASRWLSLTCTPVARPHSMSRNRALVFIADVSDRVRRRKAIQSLAAVSSEELNSLRAALDRITDAFVVLDYEGRFTYLNARAHEQFAMDDEPLVGKRFWEAFPSLTGSEIEAEYHRILREQTPSVMETRMGADSWYEVRSYPGRDGISTYIRDITSERRARADLDAALAHAGEARAEAEARAQQLDAVFEAVGDGMLVFNANGAAVDANQAMRDLVAMLGGELSLPAPAPQLDALLIRNEPGVSERAPSVEQALRRVLAGESLTGARTVDLALRAADGADLYLNISGAPIRASDGRIVGAVASLRDVTAKRQTERERNRTLSLVAHELRTPLTAIKLSIDLTLRRTQKQLEADPTTLGVAISSCLQLERMVNDLVDTARAEREQMALNFERCDAVTLASQAVAEQQATTQKVITLAAPMSPLPIIVDAARMRQVLSNLLSNAVKYSPPETSVALAVEQRDDHAWFGVSDGGPGVPAEASARLFEAFYRAPDVVSQTGPNVGLGLGLFLCKRIVDLHNGKIGQANLPQGGSLFWFSVPLAPPSESE